MRQLILGIILLTVQLPANAEDGWIQLFNGDDLSGWRANVEPDSFTVQEGVIKAHCTSNAVRSHLFYVGDQEDGFIRFKNFELKAVVRGEPNSNSGIFFHADFSTRDRKLHLANGYEVQLNSAEREKRKTGSLYSIVDLAEPATDDTKWFEVHIVVRGKRIVVRINNKKVIDYTEPENPERPPNRKGRLLNPEGGAIALQAHDPDSEWYFRDISIKRLPD
jgi:hypothetical protein